MHTSLYIHVLGTPRISRADHLPVHLRRRPRLLLYYVATQLEPVSRERCMALFWPDASPTTARQLLRTALHQIKIACGDIFGNDHRYIQLHPHVWVDVRHIHTLNAGDQQLDIMVQAPPGDFLADIDMGDVDTLEAWLYGERTRWQRRLAELFFQHAKRYANSQHYSAAQHSIRVAHQYEPMREDIVQLAMELAYRCADRAGAITLYEQLHQQLDSQLGVPPLPATTALYHAIVTDSIVTTSEPPVLAPPPEPFIGRQVALMQCHGVAWEGNVILIQGDAGIGKTRLASEYLRRSNALIMHATAFVGDQHIPYRVLTTAVRAMLQGDTHHDVRTHTVLPSIWQRELRRLWPELPGGEPDAIALDHGETRLPEAIALLLQYLGQQRRVVLFFDDAQWADDASLNALAELMRRKLTMQWQIVITMRPGELRAGLQRIVSYAVRANQLTRIPLVPLVASEIQQLAQSIDPHYDAQMVAQAEGNPFMVISLLRHGYATHAQIPDAIRDLVATRTSHVSPAAQRFIASAAVCGREFTIAQCAALAQVPHDQVPHIMDELQQHGLIHPIDAFRARFDHPLTVESIVAELGSVYTATLHMQFAQMLATHTPPDHAHIAHHYHRAGADALASPHARLAAHHAYQLGAWHEAAHYMHIAIAGCERPQQSVLWLELGEMLSWGGDWQAAADAFQQAITHDDSIDGDTSDYAQLGLVKTYLPQARYDDVIAVAETLIEHPNPHVAGDAAFVCGTAYSLAGARLDRAWYYLTRAEAICRDSTTTHMLPRILFEQGSILAQQGDITSAITRYTAALEASTTLPAHHGRTWQIFAHNNLAYHLQLLGQYGDAERHVRSGIRLANRTGMQIILSYLYSTSGEIALARGDFAHAERLFHDGLAIAERFGLPERIAGLHANLGLVARAREDIPAAIAQLTSAMHHADTLGIQHLAAQIRIWLASVSPAPRAHEYLAHAKALAQHGGRSYLLRQIAALETQ